MLFIANCLLLLIFVMLMCWRGSDILATHRLWRSLVATVSAGRPCRYDPQLVAELPEPARRYFNFTIKPGSRLHRCAEFTTTGQIGLGDKQQPNYIPMRGHQILAPPFGLVWKVSAGRGVLRFFGSDAARGSRSWTRFWLWGLLPLLRAGGNRDHARSAFGRVVAESAFWAPASLLPLNGASWQAVDANTARATLSDGEFSQSLELEVDTDGRPLRVIIQRWSDANAQKRYQLQTFGGYLSQFQDFEGYCLATHVEGGNHIGSEDYFAFYKADIVTFRFLSGGLED